MKDLDIFTLIYTISIKPNTLRSILQPNRPSYRCYIFRMHCSTMFLAFGLLSFTLARPIFPEPSTSLGLSIMPSQPHDVSFAETHNYSSNKADVRYRSDGSMDNDDGHFREDDLRHDEYSIPRNQTGANLDCLDDQEVGKNRILW